jgi:protein dispatched 1
VRACGCSIFSSSRLSATSRFRPWDCPSALSASTQTTHRTHCLFSMVPTDVVRQLSLGKTAQGPIPKPPLLFAKYVVQTPWKTLCLVIIVPVILAAIGMPSFKLNDLDGWDVRNSDSSKALDAWDEATEDLSTTPRNLNVTNKVAEASGGARTSRGATLKIFFEDISGVGDMLHPDGLSFMKWIQEKIGKSSLWTKHCQLLPGSDVCKQPKSVVTVAETGLPAFYSACSVPTEETWTSGECTLSAAFSRALVDLLHVKQNDWYVENAFAGSNHSKYVRAEWNFGLPVSGYDTPTEKLQKQNNIVKAHIIDLKEWIEKTVKSDGGVGNDRFLLLYDFSGLGGYSAMKQLAADGSWAGGSILFVLMVMTIHTHSFAIACCGMLQILMSFPVTYFFYRVVFKIEHFGTLQVLAVYVILGIGADDIFVLYDAFMQAPSEGTDGFTLAHRISWAMRRAVSAMSATSITTFFAFVVTAVSPVINIRCFGMFAGLMVIFNFLLSITVTPCLIILVHTGKIKGCGKCSSKVQGAKPKAESAPETKNYELPVEESSATHEDYTLPESDEKATDFNLPEEDPPGTVNDSVMTLQVSENISQKEQTARLRGIELFCQKTYGPFLLRIRWCVLLGILSLTGVLFSFAIRLKPSDEQIGNIWPDNHPVKKVYALAGDEFLKGEGRYLRIRAFFGLKPPGIDRAGLSPFDPTQLGTVMWDEGFDLREPSAQTYFAETCDLARKLKFVRQVDCLIDDVALFRQMNNYVPNLPIPKEHFLANLTAMLSSPLGARSKGNKMAMFDERGVLKLAGFTFILDHPWTWPVSEKEIERDAIETFLLERNKNSPPALGSGIQASSSHVWMDCQIRITQAAVMGLIIAFPLAFVCVMVATKSFLTSFAAIFSIICSVSCVIGTMVASGMELGFMESICVTVIVGLAVDYVVHYAIAYTQVYDFHNAQNLPIQQIVDNAVVGCLTELGVSVLGGASSTFGSSLFLMFCVIKYLQLFGYFLAMVIGYSLIMSSVLFPVVLSFVGNLYCERKWAKKCLSGCNKKQMTATPGEK